jgi:hypothetical protein
MYSNFKYETISLDKIFLDERNPRIVSQKSLTSQMAILKYFFEHEQLEDFIKKIASEGKNSGAERPYIIQSQDEYIVIEGNTRIAAYKILTGILKVPQGISCSVPKISEKLKQSLLSVDCSIAPDRDAMLPIMARAHFGLGDKSKWGYLGSRKSVYEEWKLGKSIPQLAKVYGCTQSKVRDYILEYDLYLEALAFNWTKKEKEILLEPSVEFNPPVRFLQSKGHKAQIGIDYDTANLKISFKDSESRAKFQHMLRKLVVSPARGLGATAGYDEVFQDYVGSVSSGQANGQIESAPTNLTTKGISKQGKGKFAHTPKPGSLFTYSAQKINNGVVRQLLKEATEINSVKFPAAATFLLRNIVESVLKHIIEEQGANKNNSQLSLEKCLDICLNNSVNLGAEDKKVLKEFKRSHLDYLNLGAHGDTIPNHSRLMATRDCIDLFIKRNV